MFRFRLLFPLSAIAFANCGGTVSLEQRPCPCSEGWSCCPQAQICVVDRAECPAPATAYCKPDWQVRESACVFEAYVRDADVCLHPDSPKVQEDFDGERDECSKQRDPDQLYRALDCTTTFGGATVQGMVVKFGNQLVLPGPDRCRLNADLLLAEPPP
jgi:hypothetical protein